MFDGLRSNGFENPMLNSWILQPLLGDTLMIVLLSLIYGFDTVDGRNLAPPGMVKTL